MFCDGFDVRVDDLGEHMPELVWCFMAATIVKRMIEGRQPAFLTKGEMLELVGYDFDEAYWKNPSMWMEKTMVHMQHQKEQ